nr:UDP-2,4-diacetamido-2,4,6-trideoxy-beta-L-altropyranose hydrolase [Caulobacter hibisci]
MFVVNAGPSVGGGHFMRSLNLARALEAGGAACAFAGPPALDALIDAFAPGAARATIADATGFNAVVFDHYGLAAPDHRAIAEGRPTLVVDDLADRLLAADLVVDAGLSRTAADYAGLVPSQAELLLGPNHAALSPAFAALRAEALARRAATPGVHRVMVSLGLTDVGGITARVVSALLPVLGERALDVVAGGAAPSLPALRDMADPRLTLHIDTRDMPALTAAADLAIGAAGSSSWERCVLGLPALSLVLADNQREAAAALSDRGAHLALGADDLRALPAAFQALADDPVARATMSAAAAGVCDGAGAARTAGRFLALIGATR